MPIKGALPVPYIVALIFAIIVVALIAYLFFFHTGIFQVEIMRIYCEVTKLKYCFEKPGVTFKEYDPKCNYLGWDIQC